MNGDTPQRRRAHQKSASPLRRPRTGLHQKTYVVLQKTFKRDPHHPNVRVIAVKLTEEAARSVVAEIPGSYIERHVATKQKFRQPIATGCTTKSAAS